MTVHPTCSFKRFCLPHWVSNIAKIYINILFCFVSWALWRTVWAASVSGLFGSVCTMTVWHLNKFCKCKHTEQLLYTKPCCLVLKLSPAQQQAPAMATYGGVSINKHLGLSPVTRTLQLTHKHMLRHTVTAASSGRGFTDTIWEYRKSLGFFVCCSWAGSPLTLFKFCFRHLALIHLIQCRPERLPNRALAYWQLLALVGIQPVMVS